MIKTLFRLVVLAIVLGGLTLGMHAYGKMKGPKPDGQGAAPVCPDTCLT